MTLKKINVSVKNAESICQRCIIDVEKLKTERTKLQKQLDEMDATLKELEKKAADTLQHYQQSNEEVEELIKLKDAQSQEQNRLTEELQKSKQVEVQIKRDYEEKRQKLDQIRGRIRQMHDEIRKLKLFPLPDCVQDDDKVDVGDCHGDSFMELIGGISSSKTLRQYNEEELQALRVHAITYQDIEDRLSVQKPNLAAIEEYRLKEEIYLQRVAELTAVTSLRDDQREQLERLKRQRHNEFSAGFNLITSKLKEMYQLITMGGDAELELVDSLDPFAEGILFSVRPPNKSWKNISNLSGGEKTLSSLALVFALHHFKPTPFYVMDEIDAALDFKNVSIVANYLKARTKNAQFIIVSLRNNMYELADRLVGIYKPFNVSKVCVVNPNKLSQFLRSSKLSLVEKVLKPVQSGVAEENQPMDTTQEEKVN